MGTFASPISAFSIPSSLCFSRTVIQPEAIVVKSMLHEDKWKDKTLNKRGRIKFCPAVSFDKCL